MLSRRLCSYLTWPAVPWVFLVSLWKIEIFFPPLFQSVSILLVSQIWWTVVKPLHLPVPSGPMDSSHQVLGTCAFWGSLNSLKKDLLLNWVVVHSPRSCLCLLHLRLALSFQNYSVQFIVCLLRVLPPRLLQNLTMEAYYEVEVAITTIIIHLYLIQLLFTLLNSLEIKLK